MATNANFTIDRLGPATVPSPLQDGTDSGYFVGEDERTLLDTVGHTWQHGGMPEHIDPVNLEVAGPRRQLYFSPKDVRAAIVTCGGVCPGLNNVIRGLTHALTMLYGVKEVLGIRYGFAGMVPGSWEPLVLTPAAVEQVHHLGGTILGTSRGPQPIDAMLDFLVQRDVQMLFAIGGDGTQRGAAALTEAALRRKLKLAIIGLPKTIDNDINLVEKTFGFETAFTIAEGMLESAHAEATSAYNGIGLVKLMGRHSGYLTTLAALANGDVNFVLIPEAPFDLQGPQGLLAHLQRRLEKRGHAVIAVAEGAGQDLLASQVASLGVDASGNRRLADVGTFLKHGIEEHFRQCNVPVNVRYIDPSYVVRSAPATPVDAAFCLQLSHNAVHAAMSGRTGMIVGLWKSTFTHVPMRTVVSERKCIDPCGPLWLTLMQAIGQPRRMVNDERG